MNAHPQDRLSAYFDGELAAEERAAIALHLRDCDACAGMLEELAAVDALARNTAVDAPAGYFEELPSRLRRRLLEKTPHRRRAATVPVPAKARPAAWPAWAYVAAATLLVAAVAPFVVRQTRQPVAFEATEATPRPASSAVPDAPAVTPPTPAPVADSARPPAASRARAEPATRSLPPASRAASAPLASSPAPRLESRESAGREQEGGKADTALSAPPPAPPSAEPSAVEGIAAEAAPAAAAAERDLASASPAPSPLEPAAATPIATVMRAQPSAVLRKAAPVERSAAQFAKLEARSAETAAEVRELRQAYRGFLTENAASPNAGEAWLRIVEHGVRLAKLSQEAADWEQARADAATARKLWAKDPVKTARLLELMREAPEKE